MKWNKCRIFADEFNERTMNKLYLTFLVATLSLTVFAQQTEVKRGRIPSPRVSAKSTGIAPQKDEKKAVIWESNFSDLQDWQIGNSAGNNANWEIGYAPQFWWSSSAPLASTSGGYMASFNSDSFAQSANQIENNAWIQSVPFSCDNFATVAVTFQQFFNKWTGRTFIQVSNDLGQTWVDYEVNASLENNDETDNPEVTMVDISPTAAYEQEVIIRFLYLSNAISDGGTDNTAGEGWDYGWIIDDVEVAELPNNDIAIKKAWHANVLWDNEYSMVPMSQTREMIPCAVIANEGALQQTVTVNAIITDDGGVVSTSTETVTLPYGAVDTIWFNSGYTPTALGEYNVTFSIPNDQDPLDNVMEAAPLLICEHVMAHDYGNNNKSFGWNPYSNDSNVVALANAPHSWGNIYYPENNESIYGVDVKFAIGTTPGTIVAARVFRFDSLGGIQGNLVQVAEEYYVVSASDIASTQTTIPFTQQAMLIQGSGYIIDIFKIDATTGQGFFLGGSDIATEDDDYSTVAYGPYGPNNEWSFYTTWGFAPYVRANFDYILSAEEQSINAISLQPNPSNGVITLTNPDNVKGHLIVTNLEGREILTTSLDGAEIIDLSNQASGVYLVQIQSGSASTVKRIVLN